MNKTQTNIDLSFQSHLRLQQITDFTDQLSNISNFQILDCSTQVNMDDEFFQEQPNQQSKKNKRKQYKQRKKIKKLEEQKSAKIKLAQIIQGIYKDKLQVEDQKMEVEKCLNKLIKGDKFHTFVNEAIRLHVSNVQKNIWEYMQQIIEQNPFEKSDEDQEFYLLIVDKLYSQYQSLRVSSRQIQKIINMFMQITSDEVVYDEDNHELDRNTFNYLIQSQENIKNLIKICQQRLSVSNVEHFKKLKQICSMMSPQEYDYYSDDEQILQKSTSIEEQQIQNIHVKNKKKRRKLKEYEYSNRHQDVIKKLQNLVIVEQERKQCKVSGSWLASLSQKVKGQIKLNH